MKYESLYPLKLQLFAEDSNDENESDQDEENLENESESEDSEKNSEKEKTFTQEDLTKIGAKEKRKAKKALLKSLGYEDEATAKSDIVAYRKYLETVEDDKAKATRLEKEAKEKASAAEQRAKLAEEKLSLVSAGVPTDCVDDVLVIARAKVTDDKDLDDVLEEMKKQDKYASFFSSTESTGTGSSFRHNSDSKKSAGEFGKGLAKSFVKKNKSNYF